MRPLEVLVDLLPERVWVLGNLRRTPVGDLHFCVGIHPRLAHPVRTVEMRGREIARGRKRALFED